MIAWFARNHVAANLLMVTILFLGLLSLFRQIPLEVWPTVERDLISVSVRLLGGTPEEVEQSITIRVEEAVHALEGVTRVTSNSQENVSTTWIEIDSRADRRKLLEEVKSKVDAIDGLPADAQRPTVNLAERQREVISVVVSGSQSELEIRKMAEQVRDDLLTLPGVTHVWLDSARPYEIAVEFSESALREFGVKPRPSCQGDTRQFL